MRNQLTTPRLLASLVVPLLFACGAENSGGETGLVQVPTCAEAGQVLSTDSSGQLICKSLPAVALTLPNCHKYSEALTSNGTGLSCTNRNVESADIITALNNLESSETLINQYTTRLNSIGGGAPARAIYCGRTTATTIGRISAANDTIFGIAAAADQCSKAPGCGTGARMCTVYDMYYSVANGAIKATDTIAKSWVYMASWQGSGEEPTAGQADNCGGYVYGSMHRSWFGTAVKWENNNAGNRSLKFYTGPTGTNEGAPCNVPLSIACCK